MVQDTGGTPFQQISEMLRENSKFLYIFPHIRTPISVFNKIRRRPHFFTSGSVATALCSLAASGFFECEDWSVPSLDEGEEEHHPVDLTSPEMIVQSANLRKTEILLHAKKVAVKWVYLSCGNEAEFLVLEEEDERAS